MSASADVEAIRLIITGGTFDKEYDKLRGELTLKRTHLPEILEDMRCTVPVRVEINRLVDSLQMDDEERENVLRAVEASLESRILITHGTDTMDRTARILGESSGLSAQEKTVVLTGAMIPYRVTGSDALFNLGCAVSAVQVLPPGVYIVMNGRVFSWDRVAKNRDTGVFEEL
jgi:L-asparaginase